MTEVRYINLRTPSFELGELPRAHSLAYRDGGYVLQTVGVIPHGAKWLPATRVDRDRLVKWLKALDYSADGPLVQHLGGKHGD